MNKNRLEAFSDGVLAIIITIMVLSLKVPDGDSLSALRDTTGNALLSYLVSFVYVGIYWNNHHHTLQLVTRIDGSVLWANLGLLFFLSFLPFTTAWMDETDFAQTPVVVYGIDLLLISLAYFVLQATIVRIQGERSPLRQAVGRDRKGKASVALYLVGILAAAIDGGTARIGVWLGLGTFVAVAVIWVIPDRRLDRAFHHSHHDSEVRQAG
ncbi:TMEM175 family protein [Streptomyces sp. NPDC059524]|uniref:TMEM175 family protein n=1 Tax=Streptomyces sp. NPDC059524 TaxID=3346856 RepID=UPI0036BC2717